MYFRSTGSEFRQLNADAHRVRPANFRTPALISHQGFWIANPNQQTRRRQREDLKKALDRLILSVASRIKLFDRDASIEPLVDGENILFVHISLPGPFLVAQHHLDAGGRLDQRTLTPAQCSVLESDHRVVSLQFNKSGCEITVCFELHTEYFTISTFAELEQCNDRDLRNRINEIQQARLGADVEGTKEAVYDWFWRDLLDDATLKYFEGDIFSHIFADFRGVVVTNDGLLNNEGSGPQIERLLPLLTPLWFEQSVYECSASYMLGGRALYMTSLGARVAEIMARGRPDSRRVPVTYLLCVSPDTNKWQTGRLINLIHAAGVSRLAALKDLAALRAAGGELAGFDHLTAAARSEVSKHPEKAPVSIKEAHSHFTNITTSFNSATKTDYGVLFRVERSRYYVARFEESVAQMRIVRVAGYHKYDQFVRQRLSATFDFIDRLGRRYERAVNALELLDGYYLTIRSNEIAQFQSDIAEAQWATEEEGKNINSSIERLQEYGEFVLIGALLPYYIMGLIAHIYERAGQSDEAVPYLTYPVWTVAFGLAVVRRMKESWLSTKIVVVVGGTAFAWFTLWIVHKAAPIVIDWLSKSLEWVVSHV